MGSTPQRSRDSGFTLVEIAIAVAILGVALVTLIGLQTRMLDTYFLERNRIQASLYAQYLMSMIEVLPEPPEIGNESKDLKSILDDVGYFDKDSFEQPNASIEGWQYTRQVTPISLPLAQDVVEDALRRVDIIIEWGESEDEEFVLTYFINTPQLGLQNAAQNLLGGES